MNARLWLMAVVATGLGVISRSAPAAESTILIAIQGTVEVMKTGQQNWLPAQTNQVLQAGDRVRTGEPGRAMLRLADDCIVRVPANTIFEIEGGHAEAPGLFLQGGSAYLNSRERPGRIPVRTRLASGAIRGTEFHIQATADGGALISVFDGEVELRNDAGQVLLRSREQGLAEPGATPKHTALIEAVNIIQWCLYYPAILDVNELALSPAETNALARSIAAYNAGDLLRARSEYPRERVTQSTEEKIYFAALSLAFGDVEVAQRALEGINSRPANALRELIATVKRPPPASTNAPQLATEWMAESYRHQSLSRLPEARDAARRAVEIAPHFGFAWSRLAELEFSFGRADEAKKALAKALELSPRNAQAWSLQGFVHAARNENQRALAAFDKAIAIDPALPTAWLGRGLVKIRIGRTTEGRQDLQAAAALNPEQAILRSYLGKAFSEEGRASLASKELNISKHLDPNDPTAWLYSALLNQQQNRINEAIRDLERSKELNNNRSIYRSQALLDQDRAVRGANLAAVYRDAGMSEVAVREAGRAVNYDPASFSAHLFLAESYYALRDPQQVNLRYETPFFTEYLVANILAPAAAGSLSPQVSAEEYSHLFERNRVGLVSSTEYRSNGDWIQSAAHYGVLDKMSYALEQDYRVHNGHRMNNESEFQTLSFRYKQELTARDSVYVQTLYYDSESGDIAQYYRASQANQFARYKEHEVPLAIAGYHREWNPEHHTLVVAGYVPDTLRVIDPIVPTFDVIRSSAGVLAGTPKSAPAYLNYRSEIELFTAEAQHIWQHQPGALIIGARAQHGEFDTRSLLGASQNTIPTDELGDIPVSNPRLSQTVSPELERYSAYSYYSWNFHDQLLLTAGVSYDRLTLPDNFRAPPLQDTEHRESQVSPKAGFIWSPLADTHLRGAFTRSLGGASYDQSVRLEPSQVAGFNQAFRSVIPEAVGGSLIGEEFTTYGLAFDHEFPTGTYVGLETEWLESEVQQQFGVFRARGFPPDVRGLPARLRPEVEFEERSLTFSVNQLIGDGWSIGARYRVVDATLDTRLAEAAPAFGAAHTENTSLLHQLNLFALFYHPSGFFAQAGAVFNAQDNDGYSPARPVDEFWQFNALVGYRFPRRRAEIAFALLNFTDEDYRLNPLTLYAELPHERTFAVRFKFNF